MPLFSYSGLTINRPIYMQFLSQGKHELKPMIVFSFFYGFRNARCINSCLISSSVCIKAGIL
jgi:hypothetical protein